MDSKIYYVFYNILEFNKIKELILKHNINQLSRKKVNELQPLFFEEIVQESIDQTKEAYKLVTLGTFPSLGQLNDVTSYLDKVHKNGVLTLEEIYEFVTSLEVVNSCKQFILNNKLNPEEFIFTYKYINALNPINTLLDQIKYCVSPNFVLYDHASAKLKQIRNSIKKCECEIKEKLNSFLKNHASLLSDNYIATRGNHYVLPVKAANKSQVKGIVIDVSATANTVFIEPYAVTENNIMLEQLHYEEELEIQRIISRIELLKSRKADNGKIIKKLERRLRKLQNNNTKFDYILHPQDSIKNLYHKIQEDAIKYFNQYDITWWQSGKDTTNSPTGHLVSSQIHCLNHLFALRTDKVAVKLIIEKATGMQFDEILPSLIDNDEHSYISFEFALNNDELLEENDNGWKRGTLCTSIDVMIMARKGENKWLIPIEWKYTETYSETDLTNKKRIERYAHLIETSKRLQVPDDGIAHSIYFIEPYYELMRQTLLCEQLIGAGYADDFFHINIIPSEHTELRKAVATGFIPMLNDETKFKIIDPKDFLVPIKENNLYPELIDYLEKRYW